MANRLAGRLLELQDLERRRLAAALHGTTGQNMAALQMSLAELAAATPQLGPRARRALSQSLELAKTCSAEIQAFSHALHPSLLDELGLAPALRTYAGEFMLRTRVALKLDLPEKMGRLSQASEIALFRIAEEGLANLHLHSGSPTAVLRLTRKAGWITLEVIDYGSGLKRARMGAGITSMRERAGQLGGRLAIKSGVGGTTVRVRVPVRRSARLKTAPA